MCSAARAVISNAKEPLSSSQRAATPFVRDAHRSFYYNVRLCAKNRWSLPYLTWRITRTEGICVCMHTYTEPNQSPHRKDLRST